jgi:hypothetical protein
MPHLVPESHLVCALGTKLLSCGVFPLFWELQLHIFGVTYSRNKIIINIKYKLISAFHIGI